MQKKKQEERRKTGRTRRSEKKELSSLNSLKDRVDLLPAKTKTQPHVSVLSHCCLIFALLTSYPLLPLLVLIDRPRSGVAPKREASPVIAAVSPSSSISALPPLTSAATTPAAPISPPQSGGSGLTRVQSLPLSLPVRKNNSAKERASKFVYVAVCFVAACSTE